MDSTDTILLLALAGGIAVIYYSQAKGGGVVRNPRPAADGVLPVSVSAVPPGANGGPYQEPATSPVGLSPQGSQTGGANWQDGTFSTKLGIVPMS